MSVMVGVVKLACGAFRGEYVSILYNGFSKIFS